MGKAAGENGGFQGFRPAALEFLGALAANNDRAWFTVRKPIYDTEVKAPLETLVVALGEAASSAGLPLVGDPARSPFRIHRDTRFSRDKSPYKTNAGAVISRSGRRDDPGVLYVHVAPDGCFLGCGFWQPPQHLLEAMRQRMSEEPEPFLAIAEAITTKGHRLSGGEELRRLPRGFEAAAGTPIATYLRWKSCIATIPLEPREIETRVLVDRAIGFAVDCRGLLAYGWELLDRGGWK
jgi:uncharacterized protein (TIGR02453 family)